MPKAKKVTFRSSKFQEDRSGILPLPIGLTPSPWYKKEDDKGAMSFKLCSNTTDKNSPQYGIQAKIFATGLVEQYICWKRDLYTIIVDQNITRAQDKFTMARRLLHGDALAVFETLTIDKDETNNEDLELVMRSLATHVFPKNALATQKAWLRQSRQAHKTGNLLMRCWVARIQEINMMLPEFPPDFDNTQMMWPKDVTKIVEYGIPQKWKAKMVKMGFVPADHQPTELFEFYESDWSHWSRCTDSLSTRLRKSRNKRAASQRTSLRAPIKTIPTHQKRV
jgi:hypothetical protein